MTRRRELALLLVIALAAFGLRAVPGVRAAEEVAAKRGLAPAAALLDSPSAYRLRLAELALATGRSPRWDRMVGPPAGTAVPYPPLPVAVLAGLAQRIAAQGNDLGGEGSAGGGHEAVLETLALWLGPIGAALAAVALALAVRIAGGSVGAALVAALAWALLAPAGAPGDLSPEPWVAAALALACAALIALGALARAGEVPDQALAALGAGFAGSAAFLADPSALWIFAAAVAGLALATLGTSEERARDLARGGVLAIAAAALPAFLAAETALAGGRAPLDPTFGPPRLLLALLAPFAFAALGAARALPRAGALLLSVLAVAVVLAIDVRLRGWIAVQWERRALWQLTGPTFALAAGALAIALGRGPSGARRLSVAALVVAVLGAARFTFANTGARAETARSRRVARVELASALRWMRAHTPSSGGWNHPEAHHDWAVRAPRSVAGLVTWHARRPVLFAPWSVPGEPEGARVRYALAGPLLGAGPAPAGRRIHPELRAPDSTPRDPASVTTILELPALAPAPGPVLRAND